MTNDKTLSKLFNCYAHNEPENSLRGAKLSEMRWWYGGWAPIIRAPVCFIINKNVTSYKTPNFKIVRCQTIHKTGQNTKASDGKGLELAMNLREDLPL